ncbi:Mss4-like protein [Rhexocercosporidium sp. MPI-PUGE-AT-0058]|nr:Mss4-like protein [Rhexocercosporidium sp. MPI-PUGE-AT-0058]
MEGTCLCGAITVRINDSELFTKRRGHICRCANCKKTAGSGMLTCSQLLQQISIIENEKVEITGEENLKQYEDKNTLSGTPLGRFFCGICGNPIKSVTPLYEGKTVLKLGIFPKIPTPEWESFSDNRQN